VSAGTCIRQDLAAHEQGIPVPPSSQTACRMLQHLAQMERDSCVGGDARSALLAEHSVVKVAHCYTWFALPTVIVQLGFPEHFDWVLVLLVAPASALVEYVGGGARCMVGVGCAEPRGVMCSVMRHSALSG
jgi:hypothetical protein